jgi:YVTN family beta-propeller protein
MLIALTAPASAAADRIAYVTDNSSNSVTPIDLATNTAGTPITLGGAPISVAITPDGKTAYVTTVGSDGVTPIDIATNTAGTPIPVGVTPLSVAVTPDGKTAYVTSLRSDGVTPIDIATNTAGTPIPVGGPSIGVGVTPDGTTAYVTTPGSSSVTPIDIATHTAGTPITVGSLPISVAITPDGQTAYVGNEGSGSVTPIDIATHTAGTPIPVGTNPAGVAITPDGTTAYVANAGSGSVTPIDVATNTARTPVTLSDAPFRVAITPDGKTAYVANEGTGSVTPIDVATNTAGTPIMLGGSATGIAVVPDQAPTAAFTASSTSVGQATTFDASGSSDSDGTVRQYQWSFGDGQAILTGSPTITHSYAAAGAYTATVTVTDNEGCSTRIIFTGQTMSCNGSPTAQVQHRVVVATPAPAPITLVAPVSTAAPHISGTADLGRSLSCSTGRWSGKPTRYGYQWKRNGSTIPGATKPTYIVHAADQGSILTCSVTASNVAGASAPIPSNEILIRRRCPQPTGQLDGTRLGPLALGLTRARARGRLPRFAVRGNGFDNFCLSPGPGIRVGYPSAKLLRSLPPNARTPIMDRIVLALTANPFYALHGARPGMRLAAVAARLKLAKALRIGVNDWYIAPGHTSDGILKVRHGTIEEIGLASKRLTTGRRAQGRFMLSFG